VREENKLRTFGLIIGSCGLLGFLVMGGGLGATSLALIPKEIINNAFRKQIIELS
jgi:hypothetical protein